MKVALFTDTFSPQINGVTNTLNRCIEYFTKKNIDYIVMAPSFGSKEMDSTHVERFLSFKFFLYPECRLSLPNKMRLTDTVLKFNPDVSHIMTEFNMGLTGLRFSKKHNIPCLSNYSTNFSDYLKYYNLEFLDKLLWDYMKWFHTQGQMCLTPSNESRNLLLNKGIKNVNIFSRGIDCDLYTPDKRKAKLRNHPQLKGKFVFLYVGRISMEKDLDYLFQAYSKLTKLYPNKAALVVTGGGPMLETYQKRFSDLNILFTGYKQSQELANIYASSDAFVFPSPTETFGNVVLEAMASGLPVVTVNSGGVKDSLIDNYNGIMCSPKNEEDILNAMRKLLLDPSATHTLSSQARKYALTKSWDSIFDELITYYQLTIEMKNFYSKLSA